MSGLIKNCIKIVKGYYKIEIFSDFPLKNNLSFIVWIFCLNTGKSKDNIQAT